MKCHYISLMIVAYAISLRAMEHVQDQHEEFLDTKELVSYACDKNLGFARDYPFKVDSALIPQYTTLNAHGFCFEPEDMMSTFFTSDIVKHASNNETTKVLEIGCGMGLLAKKVITSVATTLNVSANERTFKYVGLDLSKDHLAIATKEIIRGLNSDRVEDIWFPVTAKFPEISLLQQYTHIGTFNVGHFWTPDEYVASLRKIESLLVKGGKAYIYTAHPETQVYGPFVPVWYAARKLFHEFPGYVENLPDMVKTLESLGLVSERVTSNKFKDQLASHFLLLTPDELCGHIKKYTNLTVNYSATHNQHQGDKKLVHSCVVAVKQ